MSIRRYSAVLAALLFLLATPVLQADITDLFFTEYIEGTSNNKALEIFNGTSASINLTGAYNVQMFFNGSSTAGLTINLTGTVAAGDVFVLAQAAAVPAIKAVADQTQGSGWFNGDDAVVLRKGTTVIDVIGQIGFDPGAEWGTSLTSTADNTLRRKSSVQAGDPIGSNPFDPAIEWDGFPQDTFDGLGGGLPPPPPPVLDLEIYEIQVSGAASPVAGMLVRTLDNIVTAKAINGFFIQAPDLSTDDNPLTSEGIFVFTGSVPTVNVGDRVDVTGKATEFFNMTEIAEVTAVTVDSTGNLHPAAITLDSNFPSPSGTATDLERVEGMLVSMVDGIVTGPSDQFGDFSVVARSTRAFREPGIDFDENPEIFEIDPDALLGMPDNDLVSAKSRVSARGPMAFAFGDYQIFPSELTITAVPFVVPVRARAAGEMTVGAQNLLRLFDLINDPVVSDETPTIEEYDIRLAKASLYIRTSLGAPDVLVLEEVENLHVINDLASEIRDDDPSIIYTAFLLEGNDIGGIDIGMLIRSTVRVDSIEQIGAGTLFTDGSFLNDRPPLLMKGAYIGNGAPFPIAVIGVHQRSLSGIETTRVQNKRDAQAKELAGAIQQLQIDNPNIRLVVAGDFNAFEFSDGFVDVLGQITGNCDPAGALIPCTDIVDPDLTNQVLNLPPGERYSFVFNGSAQVLDHSLTSQPLNRFVRGFFYARGNSDGPELAHLDPSTPVRTSDHDGPVLFVITDHDGDSLPDDQDPCAQGDNRPTVVIGDCDTGVTNHVLSVGCSLADKLAEIHASSRNHGQYMSLVAHLTVDLMKNGLISGKEKGAIDSCAAQNNK